MCFMSFQLLLLIIHNIHIITTAESCPESCNLCTNSIFQCETPGLSHIPELQPFYPINRLNLPKTMILTNQRFSSGILSSLNFTNLRHLTNLSIRTSNINIIRSNTFKFLSGLDHLDLSENVDLKISRNAFAHLKLSKLKLDSIGTLSLNEDSFNQLSLITLSIQNSHLLILSPRLLKPLQNSLKILLLKHNLLRTLDIALKSIFESLSMIELNGNPFMCDCKIIWLSKILKNQFFSHRLSSTSPIEYPKCVSPPKFRKKYLHQIIDDIHTCSPPKITKINIDLLSMSKARIDCITSTTNSGSFSSTPSKNFKIAWLQNDNHFNQVFSNPLTLTMNKFNRINNNNNNFICKAENPNGFAMLDFSFAWTNTDSINNNNNNYINNSSFNINTKINQFHNTKRNQNYFHKEVFSILEMIFAILGTLIITIALFSIFCCYLNNHLANTTSASTNNINHSNGISLAAGFFKFKRRVPLRNKKTFITHSNSNLNINNNSRIKSYLSYDKGIYSETGVYGDNEDDKAPFRSNNNIINNNNNNNSNSTANINNNNTLKYPININNINNNNNNNSNNNLDNFFPPPPIILPTLPSHFHYN